MTKISKKFNKFWDVVIVLILICSVGVFAYLSHGFRNDIKSFYVLYGNRLITEDQSGLVLETTNRFDVHYLVSRNKSYDVKIIPNSDCDFSFTANGEIKKLSLVSDYSKCFDLTLSEKYFVLNVPKDITILQILQKEYSGQTVVLPDNIIYDKEYFQIEITSSDDTIIISFIMYIGVSGVNLDKRNIEF